MVFFYFDNRKLFKKKNYMSLISIRALISEEVDLMVDLKIESLYNL